MNIKETTISLPILIIDLEDISEWAKETETDLSESEMRQFMAYLHQQSWSRLIKQDLIEGPLMDYFNDWKNERAKM